MHKNTAVKINDDQLNVLSYVTGTPLQTLEANIGWYLVYLENPYPDWLIMPKTAVQQELPDVILYDEYKPY